MSDERQGLPSASGIERLALCPGSFRLEQGQPDTASAESESGTRIHAWLAGDSSIILTDEEMDVAGACEAVSENVIAAWLRSIGQEGRLPVFHMEQRLWFHVNGERRMSGQADVIAIVGDHALVLDYKSGRGEVQNPRENKQLRSLAVLVKGAHGIKTVTVAIVQPLATTNPELCRYNSEHLAQAEIELLTILDASNNPDAPLTPGDRQCKYCKAALICPARRQEFEKLSITTIHETGLTVSNQDLATLLDKCGPATKLIGQIRAEAFRRAEQDPEAWRELGFEIQTPKGKNEISDIATVTNRLNEMGVEWPDITAKCKLPKTAVKDLLRPVVKGKDITLKDAEWSVLKGATEQKPGKPKLCRIGVAEDEDA